MIWNLKKLFIIQKKLDEQILSKFKLSYSQTFLKRKLALLVELSELANEIRFFKFWSIKPSSENHVILSEFSDVLHFALTFIVQFDCLLVYKIKPIKNKLSSKQLTTFFLKLFKLAQNISDSRSTNLFLKEFLKLTYYLNFTKNDIFEAYLSKNKINIQRNNSNY
ncbi:dUTP diphosphatase [Mycoplasmoides alvi]|uniref:dUTP diphosphatase n=1 Tax=Mycoplasmoides alvi TaxID=78580 RepID=UPI00051AB6D6|nr:dUTP diphosphatase [Mycoplasmoides alvi]